MLDVFEALRFSEEGVVLAGFALPRRPYFDVSVVVVAPRSAFDEAVRCGELYHFLPSWKTTTSIDPSTSSLTNVEGQSARMLTPRNRTRAAANSTQEENLCPGLFEGANVGLKLRGCGCCDTGGCSCC